MIFKATLSQTTFLLKKREAVCVFYVLFIMVIINFIGNVLYFQGWDIVEMYQPMKILLLSYNRTNLNATNTLMLIQLYPLLVVCPAGFSLAKEYQFNIQVYLISRLGNFKYQVSKYLSVFLTIMIVFTVPFLIEIILNCISFPLSATGDLSNLSSYDRVFFTISVVMAAVMFGITKKQTYTDLVEQGNYLEQLRIAELTENIAEKGVRTKNWTTIEL